jgi:hypothetical protein
MILKGLEFLEVIRETDNEIYCICPFHKDNKASLSVNPDKKKWHCFACQVGGSLEELKLTYYSLVYHKALLKDEKQLKLLSDRYITLDDVKEFQLGYNKDNYRLSIPYIRDSFTVYGMKYHLLDKKLRKDPKQTKVCIEGKVPDFYPNWKFDNRPDNVYLVEGELDLINATKALGKSVGTFGPVNYYNKKYLKYFKDKIVTLILDNDKPGRVAADQFTVRFQDVAKEVRRCTLVDDSGNIIKDVTDYIHYYDADKFAETVHNAPAYKIEKGSDSRIIEIRSDYQKEVDDEISFQDSIKSVHYNKKVTIRGLVSGKDTSPFIVPCKVAMFCTATKKTSLCPFCPLTDNTVKLHISTLSRVMLQLMLSADMQQRHILRTLINAPRCPEIEVKNLEMVNVEDLRIIPKSPAERHFGYATRQVYRIGHDFVETNTPYIFKGIIVPEPRLQYAVILSDDTEKDQKDIDLFDITKDEITEMKTYIKKTGKFRGLIKKVEDITGVYYRESMLGVILLTYLSVLKFNLFGKDKRGYLCGLILGDTRTGKTEAVTRFSEALSIGEVISGKITSRSGIVGGVKKINGRFIINWGKLVINNKGILTIDEFNGLNYDDISKLTNIRSSGIAEIIMTETEKVMAETRLLMVANPRSSRMMRDFPYGVSAIQDLIGKPEDISRCDLFVGANIDDIPKADLMDAMEKGTNFDENDIEMLRRLILFTWTRTKDQIKIDRPAIDELKKQVLSFDYSVDIPLFEQNEGIEKLSRISIACAISNGNFDTSGNINVKPSDVRCAADFMKELFDSNSLNYGEYSLTVGRKELKDVKVMTKKVIHLGEDFIEGMLSNNQLTLRDIEDYSGLADISEAKTLTSYFVKKRALYKRYAFYEKSHAFNKLLRGLLYSMSKENKIKKIKKGGKKK